MTRSLSQILDEGKFGRYRFLVIFLCAALGLVDGYDTQAVAFVAPAIQRDWGVTSGAFATVFAANAIGAFCGAVPLGILSDRIGRKRGAMLGLAIAIFGTAASAVATTTTELAIFRFVGGIGLGSILPPLIALSSEYAPAHARRFATTAMFSSFPLGAVIGAIVTSLLVTPSNWRMAFWVGAALPAILLPLAALALPESVHWIAQRGRQCDVRSILARLGANDWDGVFPTPPSGRPAPFRAIFSKRRWEVTTLFSAASFASLLLIYLAVYWMPIIAVSAGATLRGGALASAALNLSGIVGGLIFARLADARGAGVVAVAYGMGAISLICATQFMSTTHEVAVIVVLTGFFCIGAQMTLLAVASMHYPLEIRTTGVAFISALGRLGAVVGPLLGGLVAKATNPTHGLAFTVASAAGIAGLCVAAAEWRTRAETK